jgi:branched-chain amino acid aminotransferase
MITGKILGKKYVINGISVDASGSIPDMSADIYYEVVRLIDGKLLFLHDHLARLQQSISGLGINYPGNQAIIENLDLLINENSFKKGNIRICLQNSNGNTPLLLCYFIPYFYPDPEMYNVGVKLAVYPHIRPNPGIKKWDNQFRTAVSRYIQENKVYEVVLMNQQNQITEGSRSNVFFIDQDGGLLTTPDKSILPGITRKYVLEIAAREGLPVNEKTISIDSLDRIVSVFISGTSPKVLPVKQIEKVCFNVNHPTLRLLMDEFDRLVQLSLKLL